MSTEKKHCEDYIGHWDSKKAPDCLQLFLLINRLPAAEKSLCNRSGISPKLFANHEGKRVRVVMASRLGDVGITEDLMADYGYSKRVYVQDLTEFSDKE